MLSTCLSYTLGGSLAFTFTGLDGTGAGLVVTGATGITTGLPLLFAGLDSLGASPVRGTSYGGGAESLDVRLTVRALAPPQQQQ